MDRPTGYEPLYRLKAVAPAVWIADGGWIRFAGLPFPTRMTVIRLADSGLWLHSPVAPARGLVEEVAALGTVRHLVAPNWLHYAFIAGWARHFPEAMTWGAPGVVDRAEGRGQALAIDAMLGPVAPGPWSAEIAQHLVAAGPHREVAFCHRASRTLVVTDLYENFEAAKMPWWTRPLLVLGGVAHPRGGIPRDLALLLRLHPHERRRLAATLAGWAPERLILAHGRCLATDAAAALRRAFARWP